MAERPNDHDREVLQLLGEVEALEAEQRTLDLRDRGAIDRHQRKIDEVRTKIGRLNARRNTGATSLASVSGRE